MGVRPLLCSRGTSRTSRTAPFALGVQLLCSAFQCTRNDPVGVSTTSTAMSTGVHVVSKAPSPAPSVSVDTRPLQDPDAGWHFSERAGWVMGPAATDDPSVRNILRKLAINP